MLARAIVGVLLVVATAVAPVSAAITEKAAVKQAKASAKTRLGLLKSALGAAQAAAFARVDAFEVTVRAGGFTVLGVQDLADDLAGFQTAVQEALFDVAVDTAADGKAALVELADGGTIVEIPLALANLPGGLPDQVRTAVAKLLARSYKAVNKRLAKASALVGENGDASFFAVLTAPPQLHFAFTDLRSDAILFDFAIDLRISASTTPGDGRLWIGGTTAVADVDLVVSAVPIDATFTSEDVQVASEGRGRFLARLGDMTTLPRTNYLLGAIPSSLPPGASASSSFALR